MPYYRYILIKLKNEPGHYLAFHNKDGYLVIPATSFDVDKKEVEYWCDLNLVCRQDYLDNTHCVVTEPNYTDMVIEVKI